MASFTVKQNWDSYKWELHSHVGPYREVQTFDTAADANTIALAEARKQPPHTHIKLRLARNEKGEAY